MTSEMKLAINLQPISYIASMCCVFRKTKEAFGGLSNMAGGFPLEVNRIEIRTSEALYQACRFPQLPDIQKEIIRRPSPMSAKMAGKPFINRTRPDWENTKIDIMYWCLKVKLAQNVVAFGNLLDSTDDKPIVEDSDDDRYWGAVRDRQDPSILEGANILGQLLMMLRQEYRTEERSSLLQVEPLDVPDFMMCGKQIQAVDER